MLQIFHNPACSKSRGALALLLEKDLPLEVIDYLSVPLDREQLLGLLSKLQLRPFEIIRTQDALWKSLGIALDDDAAVLAALLAHPQLLERPIVVYGERALIARPPERVALLFTS